MEKLTYCINPEDLGVYFVAKVKQSDMEILCHLDYTFSAVNRDRIRLVSPDIREGIVHRVLVVCGR